MATSRIDFSRGRRPKARPGRRMKRGPRTPSPSARSNTSDWRERRERRALTNTGGEVELAGPNRELFEPLRHALTTSGDESESRAHIHGFHSYPARMHPSTARRL